MMDGAFRTLITESWNAVFRFLVGDLKVVATQQNVDVLHGKLLDRYEAVCGERLMAPSNVSPGNAFSVDAHGRFNSALGTFFRGDGRSFVGKKDIYGPQIVEKFEESLQGGAMCPAGSLAHTRYMLHQNYRSYAENFADRYPLDLSAQALLVASRLTDGFFVSDDEIDTLRIIDALLSNPASRALGAGLLSLVRHEPFSGPHFVEMVRRAFTFRPEWRFALEGIFRDITESEVINRGGMDWEVQVIKEVNKLHVDDDPLINSMLALMSYGANVLTQIFYNVIDKRHWTPPSVVDVLLHAAASQTLNADRSKLIDAALTMTEDDDFMASDGDFPIPDRIAALISYPAFHAETENRIADLVGRMVWPSGKTHVSATEAGHKLVLLFLQNLQRLYAAMIFEERTREKAAELVGGSVVAGLLQIAATKFLSPVRMGLITAALERMQGSQVFMAEEVEYFLKPLYDNEAQAFLDSLEITLPEFLTYYYQSGRSGSNGPSGTSMPSGMVPVIPQSSSGGGWLSSPAEEIEGIIEITAADEVDYDDVDYNEDYDYEVGYDNVIDQMEDGAFEYFGYYASESIGFMEAMP